MSVFIGKGIFYFVLTSGSCAVLYALVWSLLLGIRVNKASSGSRNIYKNTFDIKGTVDDTINEIERNIRALYKEPMEIERTDQDITFKRAEPQPFFRSLRLPFEQVVFKVTEKTTGIVIVTYLVTVKRLRRNILKAVLPLLVCMCIPAVVIITFLVANSTFPSYLIQGDLTRDILHTRKQILHIFHILHFIWPPFIFLFLFRNGLKTVKKEYERFLTNIQIIE